MGSEKPRTIQGLSRSIRACRACELWEHATRGDRDSIDREIFAHTRRGDNVAVWTAPEGIGESFFEVDAPVEALLATTLALGTTAPVWS